MLLTKTAERKVLKAIKATLRLTDRQARSVILKNEYELTLFRSDYDRCVAIVDQDSRTGAGFLYLSIYAPSGDTGYYVEVTKLTLDDEDLVRWKRLPLEEAYAIPEGVQFFRDACDMVEGKILSARPDSEERLIVSVETAAGVRDMAMLVEIGTPQEVLSYANGRVGDDLILFIEEAPRAKRKDIAGDLPILEMCMDADVEWIQPLPMAA
ncbi:hypothetical protein [Erythrobacter aureus]|uniref:Uncharacterized protein n=1 Tax=Erythrobacter aureus TaxID=2182384 RepID=A0A345YIU1_9SPHN|nr:hypothetical protein [Erythrobacter aureus]AXK43843.1 hypothetical protein DVR09_15425 [Erythrobacter aureus]